MRAEHGRPDDLARTVRSAAERVVREAVINALEHAPGAPVRTGVDRGGETVTV
ncbi:hypothetical protein [Streptomyces sp. NPDC057909]|uniref:hypothetical protein n=1 Tax=Streptomyces sp. NPDC057909 TaxID=3346277 RepID=UPI0036E6D704